MGSTKSKKFVENVRLGHLSDLTDEARLTFKYTETCTYMEGLGLNRQPSYPCSCKDQPCGEDSSCMNRASQIECTSSCPSGELCQNQRFSKRQYANVSVIYLEGKGYGLRTNSNLRQQQLILEYVGEVISEEVYRQRKTEYHKQGKEHYYFMSLQKGELMDSQKKGNLSRFCNHSCSPNCFIDRWYVGGKVRLGIFAARDIEAGEELVFDYNTDTRGAEPQDCACRAKNCTGRIGQPSKPKCIVRLCLKPPVMGDTITVVHPAKSRASAKDDSPRPPSPLLPGGRAEVSAPQSRQGSLSSESSDNEDPSDPPLPTLPSLPSEIELLTVDFIESYLVSLDRIDDQLVKQMKDMRALRNEKDVELHQHRACQDRRLKAIRQKRKAHDQRIRAYRQKQDTAFAEWENELQTREELLRQSLKRMKRGLPVDEVVSQLHGRADGPWPFVKLPRQ